MKVLSSKPSIVIDDTNASELGLAENCSLREALRISLTTYSCYQDNQGNKETWDNVSPKVAKEIQRQFRLEEGRVIQDEVITKCGLDAYKKSIFQNVLDSLQEHPDYEFFMERFVFELLGKHNEKLTLSLLEQIGINTLEAFEERYKIFLKSQKKLSKSFPNFHKVKELDEYRQLIEYLASNPLFDKFLNNFLKSLAADFSKKNLGKTITVPAELTPDNLQAFFKTVELATTPALKQAALAYLTEEMQDILSQVYLPPLHLIERSTAQFELYYWLAAGHHSEIENFLIKQVTDRFLNAVEAFIIQQQKTIKDEETINVDEILSVLKEIVGLVISLEDDFSKNDSAIDLEIQKLDAYLKQTTPDTVLDEETVEKLRESLKVNITKQLKLSLYDTYATPSDKDGLKEPLLGTLQGENIINAVIDRPLSTERLTAHFLSNIDSLLLSGGELPVTVDLATGNISCSKAISEPMEILDNNEIGMSPMQFSAESFHFDPKKLKEASQEANKYFNMRHVIGLKALQTWDPATDDILQRKYNRILQPGFMEGDVEAQITAARLAGEAWLTDVLVPTLETSVWLHVAARLITEYKVPVENLNDAAHSLSQSILADYSEKIAKMREDFEDCVKTQDLLTETCRHKAEEKLKEREPLLAKDDNSYAAKLASYLEMEKNKARKAIRNQWMDQFLDQCLDKYAAVFFEKKPVHPVSENRDFVFLGPPASGKSTLSNKYCQVDDPSAYISCNPDHYRSFYRKSSQEFEEIQTEQMFIRTQDSAYLIGELVDSRLRTMKQRANVIIDAMTCKASYKDLFKNKEQTDLVFACYDDIHEVVKRAYERAGQEEASLGDKGRYINTTDLLRTHKHAGLNLLLYAPTDLPIKLYDTSGARNEPAPLIGIVRHVNGVKTLFICYETNAVAKLAAFFNKGRVNLEAQGAQSLFFKKVKKLPYQVDALLSAVKEGCKLVLEGKNSLPCLSLEKNDQGKLVLDIQDPEMLEERLGEATNEERMAIETLILYGHYGSLKELNKKCLMHNQEMSSEIAKLLYLSKVETRDTLTNDIKIG